MFRFSFFFQIAKYAKCCDYITTNVCVSEASYFSQYKQEHSFCSDVRSVLLNSQVNEKEAFFYTSSRSRRPRHSRNTFM